MRNGRLTYWPPSRRRIVSPDNKLHKSASARHLSPSLDRSTSRSPFVKSGSIDATGALGVVYSKKETAKRRSDQQYYRAVNHEAEKRAEEKGIRQELQGDAQSDGFASRTMKEIVFSTMQVEATDSRDDQRCVLRCRARTPLRIEC